MPTSSRASSLTSPLPGPRLGPSTRYSMGFGLRSSIFASATALPILCLRGAARGAPQGARGPINSRASKNHRLGWGPARQGWRPPRGVARPPPRRGHRPNARRRRQIDLNANRPAQFYRRAVEGAEGLEARLAPSSPRPERRSRERYQKWPQPGPR